MARSRNIKPAFFKNPELGGLPFGARLLFIGLWVLADRKGRLEDRPSRIAAELFPYDRDISVAEVNAWLTALAESSERFIARYVAEGSSYIQITNFIKHQSPHIKEQESTIPAPGISQASIGHTPGEHSPRQWHAPPDSLFSESLSSDSLQNPSSPLRGDGASETPALRGPKGMSESQRRWWALLQTPQYFGKAGPRGGEMHATSKIFERLVRTESEWREFRAEVEAEKKIGSGKYPQVRYLAAFLEWWRDAGKDSR